MSKLYHCWLLIVWVVVACGPETIFVRPFLDTPELHMRNGQIFLKQEKWEDARREFQRAVELDPALTEAYVGLGVALARDGEVEKGLEQLSKARAMARTEEEIAVVQNGFEDVRRIQSQRN